MIELVLWHKQKVGRTVSFIVDMVSFVQVSGEVIIFVNFNKLSQELIDYIQEHNIKIHTWFGIEKLRLFIPMTLIDEIKSYDGPNPAY